MWLNNERKYARKSLLTRSKTTAIEKGKEVSLEIFANRKMGKTYFSLTTKEGVNNYLEHRKKDVESGLIVKGRYATIKTHLQHFLDFIGKDTKLKELERIDCEDYFYERMKKLKNNVKQVTIQNEQSTINSCMKFLFRNNETHYPGTPLYDQAKETGRLYIAPEWKNFNSTLSFTHSIFSTTPVPFIPDGTSEFELKRDIVRRNFQYYFQWKIIKKILTGERGVGWVKLPPKWYLKPVEIFSLFNTAMVLFVNLSFSFLPLVFGKTVFSFVDRNQAITPPKDIKIKSRSFLRGRTSSSRLQTTKSTVKDPSFH
jgi:hypothetical protein